MKKFLLLIITIIVFIGTGKAQTVTTEIRRETTIGPNANAPRIDENTVVKDSSGAMLNYSQWHPLILTGNYAIRSMRRTNETTQFFLAKLNSAEKIALAERQKAFQKGSKSYTTTRRHTVDSTNIVKDIAGNILPYSEWKNKLSNLNYKLTVDNLADTNSSFTMIKLTAAERDDMMSRIPPPNESNFFTNGQKIENFKAWDMNDNKFVLKELEGKVVVLNFWFINCPPCRKEIPELNELVAKYASNPDVIFIAIALDDKGDIKKFIKTTPYDYHLVPIGRKYADRYGINLYPTNVVLDKTGTVRFSASGLTVNTPYWIKKTIEESLAAK